MAHSKTASARVQALRKRCNTVTSTVCSDSKDTSEHSQCANDGDAAGGPAQTVRTANVPKLTLAAEGTLPRMCCAVPAVGLLSFCVPLAVFALFLEHAFCYLTAALTVAVMFWAGNLAVWSAVGVFRVRRECALDWHRSLLRLGNGNIPPLAHIVILPNYGEDEAMLRETIENIGRSPLARDYIRVVLAMEAREGPQVVQKAESLIKATSSLFKGMIATYHPAGCPREVPGKSSNTQWAFHEALQKFEPEIKSIDPSCVFFTVGDADTLWNPQYFSAVAYKALCMPTEERKTAIWQSPVFLFRNLFTVPATTRVSGYATLLYELAGLSSPQVIAPHLCYSAYTLTLALASHPKISGWDTDVVAEDHHMFCKCYFAHLWEQTQHGMTSRKNEVTHKPIEGKLTLQPVYLPSISYLVESRDGYMSSVWARFVQARRHSEGVAELAYMCLHYARLISTVGVLGISRRTHMAIICMMLNMFTTHIINGAQAFSVMFGGILIIPALLGWIMSGQLIASVTNLATDGVMLSFIGSFSSFQGALKALFIAFGPLPPVAFVSACTNYIAVKDMLQGVYSWHGISDETTDDMPKEKTTMLGWWDSLKLFNAIQFDFSILAEPTLMLYGFAPLALATYSVLHSGCDFKYVVAAKPVKS